MKLVDSRRLYRCLACNAVLFIPVAAEAEALQDSFDEQAGDGEKNKPA